MITPDITAALAHEIKNPAAVAMAHISLAKSLDITDGISLHLNYIGQAITEINELVHEMLFATHGQPPCYHINFYEMLTEMLETYRVTWPGISFSLNAEEATFYGQEQFLRLIFSNLLKNAVEAVSTTQNPQIAITSKQTNTHLTITITNNGTTTNPKSYKNGLGITICHNLAARMNGTIEITKNQKECTAVICLPIEVLECVDFLY